MFLLATTLVAGGLGSAGCRGGVSEEQPVHLAPDMDWQPHRRAQSQSPIFSDNRAMRPVDKHTVAHGFTDEERSKRLKEEDSFYRGVGRGGAPVARMPIQVDAALVARGKDRFGIFCTPCHDQTGSGKGIVEQRSGGAFAGIPPFTLDRLQAAPDGELFQTISNGKVRMPSYAAQISEFDRWAIVAWVRVLQTSQAGSVEMLSDEEKRKLKPADKTPGGAQ
jgi:mono/diheme cytochrome c family protein